MSIFVTVFVVLLESIRMVALVAIQDKKTMHTRFPAFCVHINVLKPFASHFIDRPTVIADGNSSILWHDAISVPIQSMTLTLNSDEERDQPALRINSWDHCSPFLIARLLQFRLASSFSADSNHRWRDLTHGEAGLVEDVDICIGDPMLQDGITHKIEPGIS